VGTNGFRISISITPTNTADSDWNAVFFSYAENASAVDDFDIAIDWIKARRVSLFNQSAKVDSMSEEFRFDNSPEGLCPRRAEGAPLHPDDPHCFGMDFTQERYDKQLNAYRDWHGIKEA
jgi:hypothetical protein